MEKLLADTHAIHWFLRDDADLGINAKSVMNKIKTGEAIIHVSIMSLIELDYLVLRKKAELQVIEKLIKISREENSPIRLLDVDFSVYQAFSKIPHHSIPEMPDRIIAATAKAYSLSLVTKDLKITSWNGVPIIW